MSTAYPSSAGFGQAQPASYLPSSVRRGATNVDGPLEPFALPPNTVKDPRVQWAQRTETTLKQERAAITRRMVRNWEHYAGEGYWTGNRAPWKNSSIINYAAWVVDHWTAVLTDNKPRGTFEAHHSADQWRADVLTALWNQDAVDQNYDQAKADAIQCSRIAKVGYVYQTFDALVQTPDGAGAITLTPVDGIDVYADKDARNLQNASIVMIERREPIGALLFRYKHLVGRVKTTDNELGTLGTGPMRSVPAQSLYSAQNPGGVHTPPYHAPAAKMTAGGTGNQKVLEFFTFPKGPEAQTEVSRLRFTADNRLMLRRKMVEYEDGHTEPLQTIVTEGNIVYEVPMTVAAMYQHASEAFRGVKVLSVQDAYEVQRERVRVPLYPTGRRTIVVGDIVADDGCNPFAHGRVPLAAYHAYRKGNGSYYGFSDIDRISSQLEYLIRLNALILDAALSTGNPLWIIPTEAQIADEDITNAPGAIIRGETSMIKFARREPGPALPSYIPNHLMFTIQQIKEISGLSEAATGGKFKGQQAAETVSMYQEAAGIRFRQGQRNVEAAEVEIALQYKSNVAQFYTQPRLLRVKNEMGVEIPRTFIGRELAAPMRVTVKPGSGLPSSPSARLNLVMQLMNSPVPVWDLPAFWRILQEVGLIDSASEVEARVRKYIEAAKGGDQFALLMFPALRALMFPPQKGSKNKGGAKNSGNAGRSVRRSTPALGAASAA